MGEEVKGGSGCNHIKVKFAEHEKTGGRLLQQSPDYAERGTGGKVEQEKEKKPISRENWRHQPWELKQMQSLPSDSKKRMSQRRIGEWFDEFGDDVYLSYSGGKDSTVCLDLVAQYCSMWGIKLHVAFCDTGLEYPEIRKFVKYNTKKVAEKYGIDISFDRLRPDMNFRQVIIEYGYPVISKEISKIVYGARHSKTKKQAYINKLKGLNPDGSYSDYKQQYKKYEVLLQAPFEISNRCCVKMKEQPAIRYETQTGRKPILATMAEESKQRLDAWCKTGCNAFDSDRQMSKPISFWTEQDILRTILNEGLEIASVYGDIVPDYEKMGTVNGQMSFCDLGIEGMGETPIKTTGCTRTGCIFCGYGCHMDRGITRFQRLKETHPKLYEYCIGGGEWNDRRMWQPSNSGLGMGFVFDWLNEQFGEKFIRYK